MAGKVIGIIALVLSIVAIILPGGALVASFVVAPLLVFAWKEGALFGYIAGGLNIINIVCIIHQRFNRINQRIWPISCRE